MIDLKQLPVDITQHVEKLRNFLNISWNHVIYNIMEDHDWDDDGWFLNDWIQVNWELLVEREMLGRNLGLSQLSTVYLGGSILHPERAPEYVVFARFEEGLKDVKSQKALPDKKSLRLFSFNVLSGENKGLAFGPPFDLACLVDDETNDLYTVPVSEVRFFLHEIRGNHT